MQLIDKVAQFYEKHPFPYLPWHAPITSAVQTHDLPLLNYYAGFASCYGSTNAAASQPRILVAGCGTFEPIAVAMANPGAKITAIDVSTTSLKRLAQYSRWKGISLDIQCKSLLEVQGEYDYIISTGVLHHLPEPELGLRALVKAASPKAVFRIMVYSSYGRALLYGAKKLAQIMKVNSTKDLCSMMDALPADHPYKIYFHLYSDAENVNGMADGYLHPCDNPFTAPMLNQLLTNCELRVGKFLMNESGNPDLTTDSDLTSLDKWACLDAMDLLGELQENFIFFAGRDSVPMVDAKDWQVNPALPKSGKAFSKLLGKVLDLRSADTYELKKALFIIPGRGAE